MVEHEHGPEFRLDDLLGSGFAVVGRTMSDLSVSDDAAAVIRRLGIATVSLEGLTPVSGRLDPLFEQASAAIVRPDRYVFGHTSDQLSLDDLILELATKLRLT
ncbi:MAG: hypothetical protein ACI8TP_000815 [Acidimicrobiales bacterium]|jgi:hypothetical protein